MTDTLLERRVEMVFYRDGQWRIAEYRIRYRDGEKVVEKNVGQEGIDWWRDMEKKWDDIEILGLEDIVATEEQTQRLEDVNSIGLGDGYGSIVSDYVGFNKFPEGYKHPLKDIELKKTSQAHGISLSQREIESIELAMQISQLEIALIKTGEI